MPTHPQTKPTPLPWRLVHSGKELYIESLHDADPFICDMQMSAAAPDGSNERQEANARLIVSAVNHLAEAKEVLTDCVDSLSKCYSSSLDCDRRRACALARALLAKLDKEKT